MTMKGRKIVEHI